MLVVHHLNNSRSQRILWLLEELQLPYEIKRYWRLPHTGMAPLELRDVHPLGKSPVITDQGRAIAESGAIIDYVIRRHGGGRLQPQLTDLAYDDYVHWLHYAEGSAVLPFVIKPIGVSFGKMAAPLCRRVEAELSLTLGYIDQSLAGRDYLLGNALSGADIQMSFVGELAAAKADIALYPNLNAWVRRFQARQPYKTAIEAGGPYSLG
jgi:glutathione S-transferase